MTRWYQPVVSSPDDIQRQLSYVSVCGWRQMFRGGGCE